MAKRPVHSDSEQPAGRGRPRDPDIDERVHASTRRLLVELGYNGLSFEAVARDAGVTRPTLYLRWPSKAHLVYETLFPEPGEGIGDTGDFAADLKRFVDQMASAFSEPVFRAAFPGLLSDFYNNPQLEQTLIGLNWSTTRKDFAERLTIAVEHGDVVDPPDPDDLLDVIVGALFQRIAVVQESTDGYIEALIHLLMRGLRAGRLGRDVEPGALDGRTVESSRLPERRRLRPYPRNAQSRPAKEQA